MNLPGHELTGTRIVGELPSVDMVMLWKTVSSAVVKRGFVLEYRDLEPPRTGIFDGLRIVLDPDVGFGHSVQGVAPALEHKLEDLQHTQDRATFMRVLHAYELEAAGFGQQLLRELGVTELDQWYADFVATDWRYVERYYATDQIPPWQECVVTGAPLIQPAPIPPLQHRQVEVRFAFCTRQIAPDLQRPSGSLRPRLIQ